MSVNIKFDLNQIPIGKQINYSGWLSGWLVMKWKKMLAQLNLSLAKERESMKQKEREKGKRRKNELGRNRNNEKERRREKRETSWGRAVPSSGQAGAS